MIINGNNIEELKKFGDNYFDSIVTDPPYELGFMGKSWDSTGVANDVDLWKEVLRVLKPGGYLLSFSATRTYHRMAVAIEDSGFEIRDMIEWVYGSGFPKSLNIANALAKRDGAGTTGNTFPIKSEYQEYTLTETAKQYEGWGTALKPAHEPICMARKPLAEKTVAENVLKYGTGGINIDESRVGTEGGTKHEEGEKEYENEIYGKGLYKEFGKVIPNLGRFPANLIHDNSEEVLELFPNTHKAGNKKDMNKNLNYNASSYQMSTNRNPKIAGDNGGFASRFFKSIIYQAKASKSERGTANNHPTVKPVALMEYLIKMVTPTNGIVLDPFMGSGTTGVACVLNDFEFVGIDLDKDYCEIARARIEGVKETQTKLF